MLSLLPNMVWEWRQTNAPNAPKTTWKPWYWDSVHYAFDNMKTSIAKDVALAYPNNSQKFEEYTNSS